MVPSLPTRNGNMWTSVARPTAGPFPAYLQGMETVKHRGPFYRLPGRSQPTYKEWKPTLNGSTTAHTTGFPAYLQGMETISRMWSGGRPGGFPAYLQGMETRAPLCGVGRGRRKFPAYLQGMETHLRNPLVGGSERVPSLPTRNGNISIFETWYLSPTGSQPTYKEWKRFWDASGWRSVSGFPAYLQGMETQV